MRQFEFVSELGEITEGPGPPVRRRMAPQQPLTQTSGARQPGGEALAVSFLLQMLSSRQGRGKDLGRSLTEKGEDTGGFPHLASVNPDANRQDGDRVRSRCLLGWYL